MASLTVCRCGKYDVCFRLSMTGDCPKIVPAGPSNDGPSTVHIGDPAGTAEATD